MAVWKSTRAEEKSILGKISREGWDSSRSAGRPGALWAPWKCKTQCFLFAPINFVFKPFADFIPRHQLIDMCLQYRFSLWSMGHFCFGSTSQKHSSCSTLTYFYQHHSRLRIFPVMEGLWLGCEDLPDMRVVPFLEQAVNRKPVNYYFFFFVSLSYMSDQGMPSQM